MEKALHTRQHKLRFLMMGWDNVTSTDPWSACDFLSIKVYSIVGRFRSNCTMPILPNNKLDKPTHSILLLQYKILLHLPSDTLPLILKITITFFLQVLVCMASFPNRSPSFNSTNS
uniref:Uncharacterized protein n=1 Tax=Glossina austeni TaxID=7395 RepID=A0A1A9VS90_GLOAU